MLEHGAANEVPPSEEELELVAGQGSAIVAGASQVLSDARLADVADRLAAGDPGATRIVAELARTLRRWRRVLVGEGWRALSEDRAGDAGTAAQLALVSTGEWDVHPEVGNAFLVAGRVAKLRNDLSGARNYLSLAVALTQDDHATASVAMDSLALVLNELGRPDDALAMFAGALEVETDPANRLEIIANRGLVLAGLGEYHAAARAGEKVVAALREAGAGPTRLAVALDNLASAYNGLGEPGRALPLLDEARSFLGPGSRAVDRARNATSRAAVLARIGDSDAAHVAFVDAYEAAFEAWSTVDLGHYAAGFASRLAAARWAARTALVKELGDDAAAVAEQRRCLGEGGQLLRAGLAALHRADWREADQRLADAIPLFDRAGAEEDSLLAWSSLGALAMDSGQFGRAIEMLVQTQARAHELGAIQQEMMAVANLSLLRHKGADVAGGISELELLAQAIVLERALPSVADGLKLAGSERDRFLWGTGGMDGMLASLCEAYGAHDLAAVHWTRSLDAGRALGPEPDARLGLAGRLATRLNHANKSGDAATAWVCFLELFEVTLGSQNLPRLQALACSALGRHLAILDRATAIDLLRAAALAQRLLGAGVGPGSRAAVTDSSPVPHNLLAALLASSGDPAAGWAALQGAKGRRVIDALGNYDLAEVPVLQDALGRLGGDTFVVDLALVSDEPIPDQLVGFVVGPSSCEVVIRAPIPPHWLDELEVGDVHERGARVVACTRDEQLQRFVAEVDARLPPDASALLVPDGPLVNVPLHLVPVAGEPWGDRRRLSHLPAAGLIRSFSGVTGGRPARSLVAGDSDGSLPGAHRECVVVASLLHAHALVGTACTCDAVAEALTGGRLDVVHLALHGRGDSRRGSRAALLFAGPREPEWVPFERLLGLGLNAELVVLSGCSTAVSGPVHGQAMVSAAQAALEVGAGSVVACLWPVEDDVAAAYMTAFYRALVPVWERGPADLRVAMAGARHAVRGGPAPTAGAAPRQRRDGRRNLLPEDESAVPLPDPLVADALRWAPFVLYGDPIVAG